METDANSVRASTSRIGKGEQELRDIPQSVTVVTEKLMDDRRISTLKEALHQEPVGLGVSQRNLAPARTVFAGFAGP